MTYTFISYSHTDKEYAHKLADALQVEMLSAWIDDRIDYGSQWPHVIQEQLDNCGAFIVIMSPRSYQSAWVQNELSRAQRKRKPIFPLLLEGDPWLSVEATQYVDVRDGQLPARGFYNGIALHVPRRTEREILADYMAKIQFFADNIDDGYGKIGFDILRENVATFNRTLDLSTARLRKSMTNKETKPIEEQVDQAYITFSGDLQNFADNAHSLIPELQQNWRNFRKHTFAYFSVGKTSELVSKESIFKFRASIREMLTSTSELTYELSQKNYALENLPRDQEGRVIMAGAAATIALHEYAEELKIGTRYLVEIIKLLDETLDTFDNEK